MTTYNMISVLLYHWSK